MLDGAAGCQPLSVLEVRRRELRLACAVEGGAAVLPAEMLRMTPLVLWNGEPQPASFPGLSRCLSCGSRGFGRDGSESYRGMAA